MRLVSMLTENYVQRARPFLESLARLTGVDRYVIGLDYDYMALTDLIGSSYDHLRAESMPRHWSESSLGILQHGRWLDAPPDTRDDEVYLLTDADLVIQRDFTPEERQRFESCGENSFLAGWNACEGDTLGEEGQRIGFADNGTWAAPWGDDKTPYRVDWRNIPCFNTGVLAMRGRSWKRLRDLYESRCERFYQATGHRSRGQWLMCWCLHRLGMIPDILGLETHCHAHFGIPKDVAIRNGVAYYHDKVVLFRHAF